MRGPFENTPTPAQQFTETVKQYMGHAVATYDCDCCGKPTPRDQISRGIAYGIETFACEECWS